MEMTSAGCKRSSSGPSSSRHLPVDRTSSKPEKSKVRQQVLQNGKDARPKAQKHEEHKAEVQRIATRVCGDWSEHISSSGKRYYYNCKTEVSRWERPEGWLDDRSEVAPDQSKESKPKARSRAGKGESRRSNLQNKSSKVTSSFSALPMAVRVPSFASVDTDHASTGGDSIHSTVSLLSSDAEMTQGTSAANPPSSGLLFGTRDVAPSRTRYATSDGCNDADNRFVPFSSCSLAHSTDSLRCNCLPMDETERQDGAYRWNDSGNMEQIGDVTCEDMDISPVGSPTPTEGEPTPLGMFSEEGCRPTYDPDPFVPLLSTQHSLASSTSSFSPCSEEASAFNESMGCSALAELERMLAWTASNPSGIPLMGNFLASWIDSVIPLLKSVGRLVGQAFLDAERDMLADQAIRLLQKLRHEFPVTQLTQQHLQELQQLLRQLHQLLSLIFRVQTNDKNCQTASPPCARNSIPDCGGVHQGSHPPVTTLTSAEMSCDYVSTDSSWSVEPGNQPPASHNRFQSSSQSSPGAESSSVSDSNSVPPPMINNRFKSDQLLLTSTLAGLVDNRLTQHVRGWPAEDIERQGDRIAEEVYVLGQLRATQVSMELKQLRCMIRTNEILSTIKEQRALFLHQQCELLENDQGQYMSGRA